VPGRKCDDDIAMGDGGLPAIMQIAGQAHRDQLD
jgi:hypothetical protein